MSEKKPKFFCECCHAEVKQNAKFCPTCGKFFASVRCPNCGKIGDAKIFATGCPDCGYAVMKNSKYSKKLSSSKSDVVSVRQADELPPWILLTSFLMLISTVCAVIFLLK